jgi:hypothetical protein
MMFLRHFQTKIVENYVFGDQKNIIRILRCLKYH